MKKALYLICIFIYTPILWSQIQFSEQASLLGCTNSSYGTGVLGGGISFFDFDNDGWDDITVSSKTGEPVRFYKNNNGSFSEITFTNINSLYETKTVQWVDFDNDGDSDFFVTSNTDSNILYENDGAMNFTNITTQAGLTVVGHTTFGASWGDYNNDGWLDLFISSRSINDLTIPNILYKNNGNGTFTNVNAIAGISSTNHYSFCSAFFDYNNDGWQDIYIANDKQDSANILYKNNGDGTFTDNSVNSGTNISIDAMSTSIADYNNDGWLDIYITNTNNGNVLFKNNGDETFTNVASTTGTIMQSVAFGAVFLDADNDADTDLYVSGPLNTNTNSLSAAFYENDGTENYTIPVSSGFEVDLAKSFSNAIGDTNNDGYPEIVVLNYAPNNIFLWKNNCSQINNNWIKIKLEGVQSNRQGIGSWIEISVNGEKQYNYTLCGEGYLGQNSAYEFFGIGDATAIDYIKVTWLSGVVDTIVNPTINSQGIIIEGTNAIMLATNNEMKNNNIIEVFPNPNDGYFNIKTSQNLMNSNLIIKDVLGKTMYNEKLLNNTISLSHFSKGVYFAIINNGINTETKKIIIK